MNEVSEERAPQWNLLKTHFPTIINILKRFNKTDHAFVITMAIAIGILGGYGAVGFRLLIKFFGTLLYGEDSTMLTVLQSVHWSHRLFLPMIGGLLVGVLIYKLAREARGHGVPEVIESVAIRGGIIRPRVVFVKALASSICIGSGGAVGREGPIAQIGSAVGSSVGQIFKVSGRNLKTFVGCGAAAGIAATFNAPIAGALFSVEILLGDFRYTSFSPIVVSSVTATVISRHYLGDSPAFTVLPYQLISAWEFIPYLILGVVAGSVGYLFVKTLYRAEDYFEKLRLPEYMRPALGGLALGVIGIFLPHVYGTGYDAVDQALIAQLPIALLVGLMFAKIIATSLTLGSGGSGGVFAPSLFIGAMMGGAMGTCGSRHFTPVYRGLRRLRHGGDGGAGGGKHAGPYNRNINDLRNDRRLQDYSATHGIMHHRDPLLCQPFAGVHLSG